MIRKESINFSKKKAEINLEIKKEYLPLHSPNGTRVVNERRGGSGGEKTLFDNTERQVQFKQYK